MFCDFKHFVKKNQHQRTNTQNNFSSWFQLRAQITLWNRIFPGQWFCLKWIPPFISPHPYWPFAEDGAGVVQHCFTGKPSHTFTPNHSHATWCPTSTSTHNLMPACWCGQCLARSDTTGTELHWPVTVFYRSRSLTSTAWFHFWEIRSNKSSIVLQWIAARQRCQFN